MAKVIELKSGDKVIITIAHEAGWTAAQLAEADAYFEENFKDITFILMNGVSGLLVQRDGNDSQ